MALSPLLLAERRRRGVCKKTSLSLIALSPCAEARGLLSQNPALTKPLTASTYQPRTWNLTMHPDYDQIA